MKIDFLGTFKDLISAEVLKSDVQDGYEVRVWMEVLDINTGKSTRIWSRYLGRNPAALTPRDVRLAALMLLEHELDECLRVDGEFVNDPHPENAK